jgi:hypothetical protein
VGVVDLVGVPVQVFPEDPKCLSDSHASQA